MVSGATGANPAAQPNPAHEAVARLAAEAGEFSLITQNVDDLHARAKREGIQLSLEKMVQIHGDIFVTRCSRCDFGQRELREDEQGLPHCPQCGALMRPGVVWFGESLDPPEIERVETYLDGGACDVVIVAGTTATFGYIVDWATRAAGRNGRLIEVNPEETSLSQFASERVREPAGVALPGLVATIVNECSH